MDALLASWGDEFVLVILKALQDTAVVASDTVEAIRLVTANFFDIRLQKWKTVREKKRGKMKHNN